MQLSNLHSCCSRFLPFFFLLVQSILFTPNPTSRDNKNDVAVDIGIGAAAVVQSVVSPIILDEPINSIAGSEDGIKDWQGRPTVDTNAAAPPFDIIASTDQKTTDDNDSCSLHAPVKTGYSQQQQQRRKFRRADGDHDACTAPSLQQQFKPEERTETKPKPKPGKNNGDDDDDDASKTPANRISPHSGPSFDQTPWWKAPKKQLISPQYCPDPFLSNPVCAFRMPDMTNWVERQYPGITVDLPECYLCMFVFFFPPKRRQPSLPPLSLFPPMYLIPLMEFYKLNNSVHFFFLNDRWACCRGFHENDKNKKD